MQKVKIQPGEVYKIMANNMPADQIGHWCSDLYVKVTPFSQNVISNYEYKNIVTVFRDQITGALWYEIPFCYPGRV